jgi:hypothetical protein
MIFSLIPRLPAGRQGWAQILINLISENLCNL